MSAGRQAFAPAVSLERRPAITMEGLRHAGANLGLAAIFFTAAIPVCDRMTRPSELIWSVGMALTGLSCISRPRPSAAMLDWRAILSGTVAFVLPALMVHAESSSARFACQTAVVLEFAGLAISQTARVYMGRAFAVLPSNRGIVSRGPFCFVRHPVYLGWVLLAAGFGLAHPAAWNLVLFAATMALTFWRIALEEELLSADPQYRSYRGRVRWRLVPGVY